MRVLPGHLLVGTVSPAIPCPVVLHLLLIALTCSHSPVEYDLQGDKGFLLRSAVALALSSAGHVVGSLKEYTDHLNNCICITESLSVSGYHDNLFGQFSTFLSDTL